MKNYRIYFLDTEVVTTTEYTLTRIVQFWIIEPVTIPIGHLNRDS